MAAIPPLSNGAVQPSGLNGPASDPARQARAAAQRAFFQAALGRVDAPAPASRNPDPQAPARPAPHAQAAHEPAAPDRIPRPGSIVNILV